MTFSQTVGDLLKEKYPNYEYIMAMPYIELDPIPNTNDIYSLSLSEITANQNKYTFKSGLKKDELLIRINRILNSNSIFKSSKIIDDGSSNYVITAQIESNFMSYFAGHAYPKSSKSELKIRIKDFTYQIEVVDFNVGIRDWILPSYKQLLRENFQNYPDRSVGSLLKKESQQNWNSTFLDYSEKFSKLDKLISETNDF